MWIISKSHLLISYQLLHTILILSLKPLYLVLGTLLFQHMCHNISFFWHSCPPRVHFVPKALIRCRRRWRTCTVAQHWQTQASETWSRPDQDNPGQWERLHPSHFWNERLVSSLSLIQAFVRPGRVPGMGNQLNEVPNWFWRLQA